MQPFDNVDHQNGILNRGRVLGLPGTVLSWFISYLEGRGHVDTGGHKSEQITMIWGFDSWAAIQPVHALSRSNHT